MFSWAKFKLLAPSAEARHFKRLLCRNEDRDWLATFFMLTHFWTLVWQNHHVLYYYYDVLTGVISLSQLWAAGCNWWHLDPFLPCWGLLNVDSCQRHNVAVMPTLSLYALRTAVLKGFGAPEARRHLAQQCKGNEPTNGQATKHLSRDIPGSNDTSITDLYTSK